MTVLLQRVCWNGNDWMGPTPGRLGSEDSYVGKHGFGHEDWNFNKGDSLDGWVYGYIYQDYESVNKSIGEGPHRIYFWARRPNSTERLIVGVYRSAYFVTPEERKNVLRAFRRDGKLERRASEIASLGLGPEVFSKYGSPAELINHDFTVAIAAREDDVHLLRPMLRMRDVISPNSNDWSEYHHYAQYIRYDDRDPFEHVLKGLKSQSLPLDVDDTAPKPKVPSHRHVTATEGLQRHLEYNLTVRLQRYLELTEENLKCVPFKRYMDMVASRGNHHCLLELKSCADNTPKLKVREALGQLLYYAHHRGAHTFFAEGREPEALCIAIDTPPDPETKEWIRKLRDRLGVNLDLMWEKSHGTFESLFDWPRRL